MALTEPNQIYMNSFVKQVIKGKPMINPSTCC